MGSSLRDLPVWKTITVGGTNSNPCRGAPLQENVHIGTWSADVLNNVAVSPEPVELDLVIASPAHFGFNRSASYDEICAMSGSFDFGLCPEDTSIGLLREGYRDQPDRGSLCIASKAIRDSDGDECIFVISCDKEKVILRVMRASPNSFLSTDSQLIFVKHKRVLHEEISVN